MPFRHYEMGIDYSRVPNITGVPNKSVGGNFFLKINKTGGDLLDKKSQIRTYRREKHPRNDKISSCFIQNSRVLTKNGIHYIWNRLFF